MPAILAAVPHPHVAALRPSYVELAKPLHQMPTALLLAFALALNLLPLVDTTATPGAAGSEARRQMLIESLHILICGWDLWVSAWLLCRPFPLPLAALPALTALAFAPRLLRIPAYPLLSLPIIILALRLAGEVGG